MTRTTSILLGIILAISTTMFAGSHLGATTTDPNSIESLCPECGQIPPPPASTN